MRTALHGGLGLLDGLDVTRADHEPVDPARRAQQVERRVLELKDVEATRQQGPCGRLGLLGTYVM